MVGRVGLPRALFEVRLAQLARVGSAVDRLALVAGIVMGADLAQWVPRPSSGRLVVIGGAPLADAWHGVLARRGWDDGPAAARRGGTRAARRAGADRPPRRRAVPPRRLTRDSRVVNRRAVP